MRVLSIAALLLLAAFTLPAFADCENANSFIAFDVSTSEEQANVDFLVSYGFAGNVRTRAVEILVNGQLVSARGWSTTTRARSRTATSSAAAMATSNR